MMPKLNPRDMQKAMQRLGIKQEEIEAEEVIIKQQNKELVIKNPQVTKVNMMGQETYQITGDVHERSTNKITVEDIETVMEQANVSREEATESLKRNDGDLAKSILELKENQ